MSAVEDRRQRAREAAYDAVAKSTGYYQTRAAIEASAEVATSIKLTPEMISAVHEEMPGALRGDAVTAIRRFCAVAGLEVID